MRAQELFEVAFASDSLRTPRSQAYRKGVLSELEFRYGVIVHVENPYRIGTAEADAFFSGVQEGREIWQMEGKKMRIAGST
jgi:hypothetical protein